MKIFIYLCFYSIFVITPLNMGAFQLPLSEEEFSIILKEQQREYDAEFFHKRLKSKDLSVKKRAIIAIGRIRDTKGILPLINILKDPNPELRYNAAISLGWLHSNHSFLPLQQAYLKETSLKVKSEIAKAIGKINHPNSIFFLKDALNISKHPKLTASLLLSSGYFFSQQKSLLGLNLENSFISKIISNLSHKDIRVSNSASFALYFLIRKQGVIPKKIQPDWQKLLTDKNIDSFSKSYVLKLIKYEKPESVDKHLLNLYKYSNSLAVKTEILHAYFAYDNLDAIKLLTLLKSDENNSIKVEILIGLRNKKILEPDFFTYMNNTLVSKDESIWVKREALKTLISLSNKENQHLLFDQYVKNKDGLRLAALKSLSYIDSKKSFAKAVKNSSSEDIQSAIFATEAITKHNKNYASKIQKINLIESCRSNLMRSDFVLSYHCSEIAKKFSLNDLIPDLVATYSKIKKPDEFETKVKIIETLETLSFKDESFYEKALNDSNVFVKEKILSTYKKLFGQNLPSRKAINHQLEKLPISLKELNKILASNFTYKTNRGNFTVKPLLTAPLTAYYIGKLTKDGFYNNLTFHRVIPNFVVQGGDPRTDGWGGTGRINPEEYELDSHYRGTVGIATAGRDTGSCQFFVNLAPNYWLDYNYTIFGTVVEGMDKVDLLEQEDYIIEGKISDTLAH